MTTKSAPSNEEEAKRLLAQPLSADETIEFVRGAIKILENDEQVKQFEKDIEDVGMHAIQIDEALDRVSRGFKDMVDKYGSSFPEVAGFEREWNGYKERWVKYLWDSRDVASEMSAVLKRYDQIFLEMVESIKTDQDREDVIRELTSFSGEKHATAAQMSNNFRNLEADVRGFGARFATYLEQKQVELEQAAITLQADISILQEQIKSWNEAIAASLLAMGVGLGIGLWTLIITGTTVGYFMAQRVKAELELIAKKAELKEVNQKQRALAELKTQFDILKPDIVLICERLVIFGNIWESVSTQCKDFGRHLEKGMEALDDEEFRLQVTLARRACTPLQNGLAKYATAIDSSPFSNNPSK